MGQGFKNVTGGKTTRREGIFVFTAGVLLSLNSGYINGCCMSGLLSPLTEGTSRVQPVSAFTGTYTKSALELSAGNVPEFGFHMSMISSFIAGAFVSGFLNPKAVPYELRPAYGPTFLVGSILMICASLFAWFDPTGTTLYFFAAAANGVQNGMTSMYTANLIRTTHLTGTSTDIGLILGQMARGRFDNAWKFGVLCSLASSFWIGGILAFLSARALDQLALTCSAILFLIIGGSHMLFIMVTQHVSFWQATMGTWSWEKMLQGLKIVDKDGTTKLSEEEILEVFDALDKDKSGTLDADELYEGMKSLNINVPKARVATMVGIVDENGDGVIDRREFLALVWLMHNRATKRVRLKRCSSKSSIGSVGSIENVRGYLTRRNSIENDSDAVGQRKTRQKHDPRMSLLTPRTLNEDGTRKTPSTSLNTINDCSIDDSQQDEEMLHPVENALNPDEDDCYPDEDDFLPDDECHAEERFGKCKVTKTCSPCSISKYPDERDDDEGTANIMVDTREISSNSIGQFPSFTHNSDVFDQDTEEVDCPNRPVDHVSSDSQRGREEAKENDLPSTFEGAMLEMNKTRDAESCRAVVVTEPVSPFRVIRVNRAWEDLCGYTQNEAEGKAMRELVQGPATDHDAVRSAMGRLISKKEKCVQCTTNYRKDCTTFQKHLTMGPLVDEESGETTHLVGILRDSATTNIQLKDPSGEQEQPYQDVE